MRDFLFMPAPKKELKIKSIKFSSMPEEEKKQLLFQCFDILFANKYLLKKQRIKCQQKKGD